MFTSSAEVFRTRQAVYDLLEVVRLHRDAVVRIGSSTADSATIEAIMTNGGRITQAMSRSYSSILLAAALPDEDFNAFVGATALLLADRLQHGFGEDDLFWNYEAFRDHYRLADAPMRAALMNAFRLAHERGLCTLETVPAEEVCLTRPRSDVLQMLEAAQLGALYDAIRSDASADLAGALWAKVGGQNLSYAERAGFRYLYERPTSLTLDDAYNAPLIHWA